MVENKLNNTPELPKSPKPAVSSPAIPVPSEPVPSIEKLDDDEPLPGIEPVEDEPLPAIESLDDEPLPDLERPSDEPLPGLESIGNVPLPSLVSMDDNEPIPELLMPDFDDRSLVPEMKALRSLQEGANADN
jgi:hypothetical protein